MRGEGWMGGRKEGRPVEGWRIMRLRSQMGVETERQLCH